METLPALTTQVVRISSLRPEWEPRGPHLTAAAHRFGFTGVSRIKVSRLYFLQGQVEAGEIAEKFLVDPVAQRFEVGVVEAGPNLVEVTFHPGVTDSEADNLVAAAKRAGYRLEAAATGWSYQVEGQVDDLKALAERVLANRVVQSIAVGTPIASPLEEPAAVTPRVERVPLSGLEKAQLLELSQRLALALDEAEMSAIAAYFAQEGREPSLAELQTLAQTWSEHCVHKTFRATIDYRGPDGEEVVDGLLSTYLRRATEELDREWVVSAFVDNAGLVRFSEHYDLAIKAETHNHPSALEPFGGANTGVGGVVRDILGVSARPMANTDVLCFAPPETDDVPEGSLHPVTVIDGVVRGIADYGNKMGIPTVAGGVVFHPDYVANPLVYCGCLGILPRGGHPTGARAGDRVVVVGGRTGRDGLGGATFSSMEMDVSTAATFSTAVQIGNPIVEKLVGEALLVARDQGLYAAVTDCGAGGLSSAVGEMAGELGAVVQLETVPTKYPGLLPWELWLSEAQERMVFAVADEHWDAFEAVFTDHGVEAVTIGRFGNRGRLRLVYGELEVADLATDFLHHGIPRQRRTAEWQAPGGRRESLPEVEAGQALLKLLAEPNLSSRQAVVAYFDSEVQGGTAGKPEPTADGSVLVPLELQGQSDPPAAVLGLGMCPHRSASDPRLMAWMAVDEAVRNAVVKGADPDQIALLDNFCWGNPRLPDRLGALVRCCQGCYEASMAYGAPWVSGKDSLNNEFKTADGSRKAIPGTLLIHALGRLPKVSLTVPDRLQKAGHALYVVGETADELGDSAYLRAFDGHSARLPQPRPEALENYRHYHRAVLAGLVVSAHDLSDGGLAVALAEMCLASGLGAELEKTDMVTLFSESMGRLLVEVADGPTFEQAVPAARRVGQVSAEPRFLGVAVSRLKAAFENHPFDFLELSQAQPPAFTSRLAPAPALVKAPRVAVLTAPGSNREEEARLALELAGARAEIVPLRRANRLEDYGMVVLPGGFSYGDDLGAGRLWALDLQARLGDQLCAFVEQDRLLLGICNGFQALVRTGILPGTLAHNQAGHFECRWVELMPEKASVSVFTQGLAESVECPMAHGEGRYLASAEVMAQLAENGQIALRYASNPNGSLGDVAGICNPRGNVLGLMPHPEDNVFAWQHPRRGPASGLALLRNGLGWLRLG